MNSSIAITLLMYAFMGCGVGFVVLYGTEALVDWWYSDSLEDDSEA